MSLDDFLKSQNVVGLEGIDTRALTRVLRDYGVMKGVIMKGEPSDGDVQKLMDTLDNSKVVKATTAEKVYTVNEVGKKHIAFVDLGAKQGIVRELVKRDCKLTIFPFDAKPEEIENVNPDMVFLSNGPGDPLDIPETVETVKALIGKYPIYGICMGHLVIGLALGCKTKKLKFGHHGANHPVVDLATKRVYITSQNHGFMVDEASLPENVQVTHKSLFDGSLQGFELKDAPVFCFQGHPEASPGPHDIQPLFDRFIANIQKYKESL